MKKIFSTLALCVTLCTLMAITAGCGDTTKKTTTMTPTVTVTPTLTVTLTPTATTKP